MAPDRRRYGNAERGFTLIELLIVVTVMPIIVGAISGGLFTVLSLQTSTSSRLSDVSDAQAVSSTFIKDVQSATFITNSKTSSPQCGNPSYTQLLGLQWGNSPSDIAGGVFTDPATLVSYDIVPVTGGPTTTYSLVREYCTAGNYTTPASSTTVSYDIAGPLTVTTPPTPTQPAPCFSSSCNPYVRDPQLGWTPGGSLSIPVVKFEITEVKSGLLYTLMANSLSWTPADAYLSVPAVSFSPITILGSGSSTLNLSPSSVLTITGTGSAGTTAAIASSVDGSVSIPEDAAVNASAVFSEDPNLASLTGGGLGLSTPEYYASSIPDPLKSIFNATTAPTASAPWPLTSTSCSGTWPTYTCGSGLYGSDPAFPSGSHVCFCDPFGDYEFAKTFMIPSNSTIVFDEGDYVFDGSPAIAPDSPPANQNLTWQSPAPPSPPSTSSSSPSHTWDPAATSDSGLPALITLDKNSSGCSYNAATDVVTFLSAGTCLVDANQAGNTSFNPADQIQQVVQIGGTLNPSQTITFTSTSPSPTAINATYTPTATSTSGLSVTYAASPAGVCSYSAGTGVVTFLSAGTCLINASQSGIPGYQQAPVAQQAVVVIAGTGTTTITGNNIEFYIPSGSVDFGNNTAVELTPLLDGVTIWDATSNPATSVTINNIADNRNTYGGIYIPEGNVNATTTSFSGTMSVMFIVANTFSMAQTVTLNVTGP
jgi:prepilin-type N-terminal cleavage/methylation domain-containing protein